MLELLLKEEVYQEKELLIREMMVVVDLMDQDLTVLVAVAVLVVSVKMVLVQLQLHKVVLVE